MNRQMKRQKDREIKKEMDVLKKLSPTQVKKVNEIIEKISQANTREGLEIIDRSLTTILIEEGWSLEKIDNAKFELGELMKEESIKLRELEGDNVDMKKLSEEVRNYMKKLMDKGKNKTEIVKDTAFKFPNLSKNMIAGEYAKVKEEYITGCKAEEAAKEVKKEAKKLAKEVANNLEKEIEESKEEDKMSRFKINKQEIIKKLEFEGENGKYKAETGVGVELQANGVSLAFSTVKDLDKFYEEYRQAFELI